MPSNVNFETLATPPRLSLSERKRRRDRWGWAMIGISAVLLGGLFVAGYFVPSVNLNENFCMRGEATARQIILVIDQTDPFESLGKNTIKTRIADLIKETIGKTKKGEKISLFSFSGSNERRFPPIAQACNPGEWKEHNQWLDNEKTVTKNYTGFSNRIAQQIQRVTADESTTWSPILEALTDIATRDEFIPSRAANRMIIVSDMIQHSKSISFYDYKKTKKAIGHSDEELAQALRSVAGDQGLDLANFDIEVHELFHEKHPADSDEVRKTWERLLKARVKSMTWTQI